MWPSTIAASIEMLQQIIAGHPDGIVVVDHDGIVAFANTAAVRLLCLPGTPLVGGEFGHSMAVSGPTQIYLPATGLVAEMRVSELDWAGSPAHLVALRDVTARWEGPERQPPATIRTMLSNEAEQVMGLGSWEVDLATRHVTRSPGYTRILGASAANIASDPHLLTEMVHPDDRERWQKAMDPLLTGERPTDLEFRFMRPDGEVRFVHSVIRPVTDDGGRPVKLCGLTRDITDERRAVEVLRASEERFRLLAEYSQDAIFLLRMVPRPTVEYMSPAAESVLGHSPDELIGELQESLSALRPPNRAIVERALRSPSSEPMVFESRQRDGTMAWFEVRMFGIQDHAGQIVAYEGNIRRVTERVLAERQQHRLAQQLEEAERLEALGQLAGGVAHDFNNLLAVITGTAEFLADDIRSGVPQLADVQRIAHAAERGAALTRQLLIFSRREPSQPEVLDLNEVVTRIDDLLRRTISEDVQLVRRLSPGLSAVCIDRSKLEQVVLNLVLNARAAMDEGGLLTLATDGVVIEPGVTSPDTGGQPIPAGAYVRLTVADTGSGMSPEVARRAFEPFFTTREPGKGTGLGLATVHGVVKEAGGYIALDSRPNAGTTVHVCLPACTARADPAAEAGVDAPRGNGETVLVVEDEDPVREVVTRILSRNDYQVLTAHHPAEAIEICADPARGIDMLLTDVIMPGMSGTRLAERLRDTTRPGLPVLYMSGYTADQQPADETTDLPVLHKPFDAGTLLHRIHETLNASQTH